MNDPPAKSILMCIYFSEGSTNLIPVLWNLFLIITSNGQNYLQLCKIEKIWSQRVLCSQNSQVRVFSQAKTVCHLVWQKYVSGNDCFCTVYDNKSSMNWYWINACLFLTYIVSTVRTLHQWSARLARNSKDCWSGSL